MSIIVKIIAFLIIAVSLSILFMPNLIMDWIQANSLNLSFYYTAIMSRMSIGIIFFLAAKHSRYPGIIKSLAIISFIAALIFLLIGHGQFLNFVSTYIPRFKSFASISGIIGMAAGVFLLYAFSTKPDDV